MVLATAVPDDERGDEVEERRPEDRQPGESTRVETTVAMELRCRGSR